MVNVDSISDDYFIMKNKSYNKLMFIIDASLVNVKKLFFNATKTSTQKYLDIFPSYKDSL